MSVCGNGCSGPTVRQWCQLPVDVWTAVLFEFLGCDLLDLVSVDNACGSVAWRSWWLQWLLGAVIFNSPANRALLKRASTELERSSACLQWISSRKVLLLELWIDVALLAQLAPERQSLCRSLHLLESCSEHLSLSAEALPRLDLCLPGVRDLNCSQWRSMEDTHLDCLLQWDLRLRSLALPAAALSASRVSALLLRHAETLRSVVYVNLHADALADALGRCGALTHLRQPRPCSVQALLRMCAQHPQLEALELAAQAEDIPPRLRVDASVVLRIAHFCRGLRTIDAAGVPFLGGEALGHLLATLPRLEQVSLARYHFFVSNPAEATATRTKTMELHCEEVETFALLMDFLAHCPWPLTHFSCALDLESALFLADHSGDTLQTLEARLDPSVDAPALVHALARCPCLQTLRLDHAAVADDALLAQLDRLCPALLALELQHARGLTDEAVERLLRAYAAAGSPMALLSFPGCALLTRRLLMVAMHFLPTLCTLRVAATNVRKEDVLAFVVVAEKMVHAPSLQITVSGPQDRDWLHAELRRRGRGRWVELAALPARAFWS